MGKIYSEVAAERVTNWLYANNDYNEIDYLKAKLGIEATVINISKIAIVYLISCIFSLLVPTLITHLSYLSLRRCSRGLHAKSSFICTIVSIMMFVLIPSLLQDVIIGNDLLFLIGTTSTILFGIYAPSDTEKAPIIGVERRKKLKRLTILMNGIILIIALLAESTIFRTLIVAGSLMQLVMILPITYKILGRSCNNYEEYETELQ